MKYIQEILANCYIWNGDYMTITSKPDDQYLLVQIIFWIIVSYTIIGTIKNLIVLEPNNNFKVPFRINLLVFCINTPLIFLFHLILAIILINTTFIGFVVLGIGYSIVSCAMTTDDEAFMYADKIYLYFVNKEVDKNKIANMKHQQKTYLINEKTFLNGNNPQRVQRKLKADFSSN